MINYPTIILPNPTAHCAGPFPLGIRPSEALFAGLKARFGRRPLLLLVRTLFEVLLTRSPRPFGVALLTLSLVPSKASDGIHIRIARRPFAICAVQGFAIWQFGRFREFMFLLLLTTSAPTCLQHSCNLGTALL